MKLFLDLDGPILDVRKKYYMCYLLSLKNLGFSNVLPLNQYWKMKQNKVPDQEILSETGAGISLIQYQEYRNQLIETWSMMLYDRVWEELFQVYEALSKRYQLILVTLRTKREMLIKELKHLKIDHWFEKILSGQGIGQEKWKTKVKLIMNECSADEYEDAFFVGDTETDVLAAKALKIKSVAVSFGIRSPSLLRSIEPDYIFDTKIKLAEFLKQGFLYANNR